MTNFFPFNDAKDMSKLMTFAIKFPWDYHFFDKEDGIDNLIKKFNKYSDWDEEKKSMIERIINFRNECGLTIIKSGKKERGGDAVGHEYLVSFTLNGKRKVFSCPLVVFDGCPDIIDWLYIKEVE